MVACQAASCTDSRFFMPAFWTFFMVSNHFSAGFSHFAEAHRPIPSPAENFSCLSHKYYVDKIVSKGYNGYKFVTSPVTDLVTVSFLGGTAWLTTTTF